MDKEILQTIEKNKELFVPNIIAKKQMATIEKYLQNKKLDRTEQGYLYKNIRKKLEALRTIVPKQDPSVYFYNPQHMLKERKQHAIEILTKLKAQGKQAFISGSFLFMEKYNDIDMFILAKRRREVYRGKEQYIYFREQDLTKPIFQAAAKSCISNFEMTLPKIKKRKLDFSETLTSYQEAIIAVMDNEDTKDIKRFITDYATYYLNTTLDSFELNKEHQKLIKREDIIDALSKMLKELFFENFNSIYYLRWLKEYTKRLREDTKTITPHEHFLIYIEAYEAIINEQHKRRNK